MTPATAHAALIAMVFSVSLSGPIACSRADPSVLIVIADDQGWGDFSRHGNTNLATPNLDRLAIEGASVDRFYVQPVCAPTRAELLAGRYAPRDGVLGVTAGRERLAADVPTMADAFRQAGYATAAFGKWHNGTQAPHHPLCRGFDHYYGFTSGHLADYFAPLLDRDGEMIQGERYLPDDITDRAIRFLERPGEEPRFAWVAYNTPHSPMQVPPRWWRGHADRPLVQRGTDPQREDQPHTRAALAMVENLDWNVGRLLEAVDRRGDTLVVYLSDNGPNGHRFNAGLRGIKGSTDEGGVRSALFLRQPGAIASGLSISGPIGAIDLLPTLAEWCGLALPEGPALDGVSFAGALRGDPFEPSDRVLFSHWGGRVAARQANLVLDEKQRLYDLSVDPGQSNDLSQSRPEDRSRLLQEATRWREEVLVNSAQRPEPFIVGGGLPSTQLPARDATATGGVERSNRYFNSTFFTDWRTTDGAIAWDVRVETPGAYRATLYYTCPEQEIGSTIQLSLGSSRCEGTVTTAHDPPLIASQNDAVPRREGDMKRFAPMDLGVIELEQGEGKLTLRATRIPAGGVMDLRLLVLSLQDSPKASAN